MYTCIDMRVYRYMYPSLCKPHFAFMRSVASGKSQLALLCISIFNPWAHSPLASNAYSTAIFHDLVPSEVTGKIRPSPDYTRGYSGLGKIIPGYSMVLANLYPDRPKYTSGYKLTKAIIYPV